MTLPVDYAFLLETLAPVFDAYAPHTVVLYGSRARGDATEASDWDVVVVTDGTDRTHLAWATPSGDVDVFVETVAGFQTVDEAALRFLGGVVVRDDHGLVGPLFARLEAFRVAGPPPMPIAERQTHAAWCRKMVKRMKRHDVEGDHRRAWLLVDCLSLWFRLRDRFYPGPKQALQVLAESDPAFAQVYAEAVTPGAFDELVEEMVEGLLKGVGL
jgi:hypothetical protein